MATPINLKQTIDKLLIEPVPSVDLRHAAAKKAEELKDMLKDLEDKSSDVPEVLFTAVPFAVQERRATAMKAERLRADSIHALEAQSHMKVTLAKNAAAAELQKKQQQKAEQKTMHALSRTEAFTSVTSVTPPNPKSTNVDAHLYAKVQDTVFNQKTSSEMSVLGSKDNNLLDKLTTNMQAAVQEVKATLTDINDNLGIFTTNKSDSVAAQSNTDKLNAQAFTNSELNSKSAIEPLTTAAAPLIDEQAPNITTATTQSTADIDSQQLKKEVEQSLPLTAAPSELFSSVQQAAAKQADAAPMPSRPMTNPQANAATAAENGLRAGETTFEFKSWQGGNNETPSVVIKGSADSGYQLIASDEQVKLRLDEHAQTSPLEGAEVSYAIDSTESSTDQEHQQRRNASDDENTDA